MSGVSDTTDSARTQDRPKVKLKSPSRGRWKRFQALSWMWLEHVQIRGWLEDAPDTSLHIMNWGQPGGSAVVIMATCILDVVAFCKQSQSAYMNRRRLSRRYASSFLRIRSPHPPNSIQRRGQLGDLRCIFTVKGQTCLVVASVDFIGPLILEEWALTWLHPQFENHGRHYHESANPYNWGRAGLWVH